MSFYGFRVIRDKQQWGGGEIKRLDLNFASLFNVLKDNFSLRF